MSAESIVDPAKYDENNVAGTLSLLNGIRAGGCDKVVFSSSCAVYGQPYTLPIAETAATLPTNPYGVSKLMSERILADYAPAYGLRSISLRYFNASGADAGRALGELRDPETHLNSSRADGASRPHNRLPRVLLLFFARRTERRSATTSTCLTLPMLTCPPSNCCLADIPAGYLTWVRV